MQRYERIHVLVRGLVQGVGFRFFTIREARRLGLTGWVRNLDDGSVEAVAEGEEGTLHEFVKSLHQGPPAAAVRSVQTSAADYRAEFDNFDVRH